MPHGKSPRSYKANVGPILDRAVESMPTEVKPLVDRKPTLAECIKYGMDLKHAGEANPEQLTKDDYILLRQKDVKVKDIRTMYGFKDANHFYKTISKFNIDPLAYKADLVEENEEAVELDHDTDSVESTDPQITTSDHLPIEFADPIVTPAWSAKPSIITKHICPICYEEHDDLTDAETCLNSHAYITGIDKTDGVCAFNCPSFVYVTMNDGRVMKYVAFGLDDE